MIKAIVTDIEGTTSALSFVKDVLFPYAREHMAGYVRQHADNPRMQELIADVRAEVASDLSLEEVIQQLVQWIDEDRKITPLKAIQGLLWEEGYRNGDFTGHVYPDARQKLADWHAQGVRLYVYSSGSVYAQKLLFGYSDYGDLTPLFDGYFDTRIGAKVDAGSYRRIVGELNVRPEEILFLSDIEKELDAARKAGMRTLWLVRENAPAAHAAHTQVSDFTSIEVDRIA